MNTLLDWEQKNVKEPLLVIGARQIGKTYIIKEFCNANYKNYIYLNFEDIPGLSSAFSGNLIPEEIIRNIEAIIGKKIEKDTAIFFDEIQICERAITSLKYFCESEINYRIIGAGSLLGVKLHRFQTSFPVGKVRILNMYPMDFEEFLFALNEDRLVEAIKSSYNNRSPIIDALHEKALKYYMDFLVIGGMPQAILNYIQNEKNVMHFEKVIHTSIIASYIADMRKYTQSGAETIKINEIYESVPAQLAKENSKFRYNLIKPTANKRDYELPLDWLIASSMIYKATKLTRLETPLKIYADQNFFKVYLSDVGLLSTLSGVDYKSIFYTENNIFKGALTENYIAQTLIAKEKDLFYYKPSQTMEIDFILQLDGNIIPIEVKSGTHIRSRSLTNYIQKYKPVYAIRLSMRNFGFSNNIFSVPLYAAFCI